MERESRASRMTRQQKLAVCRVLDRLFAQQEVVSWDDIFTGVCDAGIGVDNWLVVRNLLVNMPGIKRLPGIEIREDGTYVSLGERYTTR